MLRATGHARMVRIELETGIIRQYARGDLRGARCMLLLAATTKFHFSVNALSSPLTSRRNLTSTSSTPITSQREQTINKHQALINMRQYHIFYPGMSLAGKPSSWSRKFITPPHTLCVFPFQQTTSHKNFTSLQNSYNAPDVIQIRKFTPEI